MGEVAFAQVTTAPLEEGRLREAVAVSHAGAVVTFCGVVRDHDENRSVSALTYEAHPTAERVLGEIAEKIAGGPIAAVAVAHRVGRLRIGEIAVICAVSAAHRTEAFAACSRLIDEVKLRVPIWKLQQFTDETCVWKNAHGSPSDRLSP